MIPGKNEAFDLRNRKSTSVTAATASGVLPAGGAAGTILTKTTGADYDVSWATNNAINKGDGFFVRIRNNTGATLTKGQVVYPNGANGNIVTVALARANNDANSARTFGLISEDILVNDEGWVQIEGYLNGVDTQSFTDGTQLYLSPTTAGTYTQTKPSAPNHLVYVGVVAKAASGAGGGSILIKVQNGYELEELHDVAISGVANNDVLQYESSTDLWKNKTLFNAGIMGLAGGTFTGNVTFNVNTTGYGTLTQWSNNQLAVAVRNGQNAVTNLVEYSSNAGTVEGGVTTNGLLWSGATSAPVLGHQYTLTSAAFVSTSQATFTTSVVRATNPYAVNQKIIVSGVTGGTYNGSWIVTAIGGSSGAWTATVTAPALTTPFTNVAGTGGIGAIESGAFFRSLSEGSTVLTLQLAGSSGTSSDFLRLYDGSNNLRTYITSAGDIVAPAISAIWSLTASAQDVSVNALRVRTSLASGYRANLQTWESSSSVIAGVNSPGKFFTGSTGPLTTATGGTIQSIATGANPLVTMASAHGLAVGEVVTLAGTTGGTYNGSFFVASVPLSTTFTITTALTAGQAGAAGTVALPAQSSIIARSAATLGQIIRGASGQTADLLSLQDSAGTARFWVNPNGTFISIGTGIVTGDFRAGTNAYFNAALNVASRATTEIGAVVRGFNGQTADLQQWQSWDGTTATTVARVAGGTFAGYLYARGLSTNNSRVVLEEGASGAWIDMLKVTSTPGSPSTDRGRIFFRDGTTSGTLRLAARTGASGVEETLVDNISSTGSTAGAQFVGAGGVRTTGLINTNSSQYGNNILWSAPTSTTYYLLATLPTSNAGTYDHIKIDAMYGGWTQGAISTSTFTFSNRDGFVWRHYLSGQGTIGNVKLRAYSLANGSVEIWVSGEASQFLKFAYNISSAQQVVTVANPVPTTTVPTGTVVFDSSNVATYPPLEQQHGALNILGTTTGTIPFLVRGANGQTANLQEWRTFNGTTATTTGFINSAGNGQLPILGLGDGAALGTLGGHLRVLTAGTGAIGIALRGISGQTANLLEVYNNSTSPVNRILPNGSMLLGNTAIGDNNYISLIAAGGGATGTSGIRWGDNATGSNWFSLAADTTSGNLSLISNVDRRFVVRGANGQTNDIQQWQTWNGTTATVRSSITSTGGMYTSAGFSLGGANSPINLPTGGNGTSGQVLTSSGSGTTPTWATPATYSLPIASAGSLGGIRVGTNLSIDGSGVLSATDTNTTYTLSSDTSGTLTLTPSGGSASDLPINGWNATNWDTAYTDRNKWDGGATGLTASTGRTSLGLGTAATKDIPATGNASATEVVYGTDTRLTDSRTPTSHTHGNITNTGTLSTSVTATNPVKVVITDSGNVLGTLTTSGASATTFLRGDGTWVTPTDTNTTYTFATGTTNGTFNFTPSGGSATSVAIFGLNSAAYQPTTAFAAASHTHGNIINGGTMTTTVTATNPVKMVITDSSNTLGLLTTSGASNTTFLRGDGTWATPAGALGFVGSFQTTSSSSSSAITLAPSTVSTTPAAAISVVGGATTNTSGTGGAVNITGGSSTSGTGLSSGGTVNITGGASNTTNAVGGSVNINGGLGSAANGNGYVSIGTTTTDGVTIGAALTLTTGVAGTLNLVNGSSPLQVQGNAGTTGHVLTSQGTGATPTWAAAPTAAIKVAANRTTTAAGSALAINTQEVATTVTFPSGRFSVAPSVTAATSSTRYVAAVQSVTSTGFTLAVRNVSDATGTTYTWHYQAIEIVAGMGN
jgi:hypothetical protein